MASSTMMASSISFTSLTFNNKGLAKNSVSLSINGKSFPSFRLQAAPPRFSVSCAAKPEKVDKVFEIVKKQLAVQPDVAVSRDSKCAARRSFCRRLPPIQSGDIIDYRNSTLISRFISEQGKVLSRRVNKLTLKQQRLITTAIKQARILSLLPFLNNEKQFERTKSTTRTAGRRARNK